MAARHVSVQLRTTGSCRRQPRLRETPCRIERIERIVSLAGPLDDEQRQRLLEIAEDVRSTARSWATTDRHTTEKHRLTVRWCTPNWLPELCSCRET